MKSGKRLRCLDSMEINHTTIISYILSQDNPLRIPVPGVFTDMISINIRNNAMQRFIANNDGMTRELCVKHLYR